MKQSLAEEVAWLRSILLTRFSLRVLTQENVDHAIRVMAARWLRAKRRVGMSTTTSDAIENAIDEMARTGLFTDILVRMLDEDTKSITLIRAIDLVLRECDVTCGAAADLRSRIATEMTAMRERAAKDLTSPKRKPAKLKELT